MPLLGSFNGRIPDSDSGHLGSTPSPRATSSRSEAKLRAGDGGRRDQTVTLSGCSVSSFRQHELTTQFRPSSMVERSEPLSDNIPNFHIVIQRFEMATNKQAVKRWRDATKQMILKAMGGSCQICGYSKYSGSLALHHLDPSEKDFMICKVHANPVSWFRIVNELRKCVLLCHNCHCEVHAGVAMIPSSAKSFDESFANYDRKPIKALDVCPICNGSKPVSQTTCSKKCAATIKSKVNWASVDLPNMLESNSIIGVARLLGCSDAAVHKRMKKIGLKQR